MTMDWSSYWVGVATPIVLVITVVVVAEFVAWCRWWSHRDLGRGRQHDADYLDRDTGKWYPRGRHTHWWPPGTPWWLIHACEPVRVWLCYRSGDHRPPTPREGA